MECTEGKMLLETTLDISFDEKVFLLIVACNLFHKAAFINFVFLKHCRINLLGLKCKTPLVITLDIYFLGKALLLINTCDCLATWHHEFQCSHEPVLKLFSNLSLKFF